MGSQGSPAGVGGRLETTNNPFAAMPGHIREGYFNRPAHTLTSELPLVQQPRGAARVERFVPEVPLDEPVLLSDLAPDVLEDGGHDLAPAETGAALRRAALASALDQLARGGEGSISAGRLVAALTRLLLRRGLVTEPELLEELGRRT